MNTKVDQSFDVEPAGLKMAGVSAASSSSSKVSMFGKKSGFVILKNKLSGSLVPIFQGNKKLGSGDSTSEESGKQGQRKTKWGPDLLHGGGLGRL
ncbi:hypothetical protein EUGRSUZ_J01795 [Eucalyptus grandis]|uniref:Uncharacterized protein n=2 Tax=Eucalyptus grandis TaxID=71139 RepID=A0ACC3J6J7_EUCGR|nr:hypothetical protein EUGRSUZ_J01795 [Eucalyptus grandis]